MTGVIAGIKRSAVHDGEGIRTTVFFKGCPLKCIWCHNPETVDFRPQVGLYESKCLKCGACVDSCLKNAIQMENGSPVTDLSICEGCFRCVENCPGDARVGYGRKWHVEELLSYLLKDRCFFDHSNGGVTLSGGECLAQADFAIELAKGLYHIGVCVDIDTCGSVNQNVFRSVAPYTKSFLYDIKAIDPIVHKRCTGRDNALILDNLRYLCDIGSSVEIRYPYVPGWNDKECSSIGEFLSTLHGISKVKVLGYHNFADGKYGALNLPNKMPDITVLAQDLEEPVRILKSFGLNAVNGMVDD